MGKLFDLQKNSNIWRPYTQMQTALPVVAVEHAEGAYLYTEDGKKILDAISSWWVITHGHCHPKIISAICDQAKKIDQVIFAGFTHEPAEVLSKAILEKLQHTNLRKVFFSDNGSTAVEVALKMALQACAQKGLPKKKNFIAFEHAYHGDTVGAMSVSGEGLFTEPYRDFIFRVLRAKQGKYSYQSQEEYVSHFRELMEQYHEQVAGVILEPLVQGAGGMICWKKESIQEIAYLCKKYDVYLIFDEVMTGFGRTGSLFALDRCEVSPDLLCLSKGITGGVLPLALTIATEEIYQAFLSEDSKKMFFHGHSFTGNPIACAAAVANLEVFREENTLEKILKIEQWHQQNREKIPSSLPILDARVCGTIAAIEMDAKAWKNSGYTSEVGGKIRAMALAAGVLLRPLGNIIYFLPPYCIEKSEVDHVWLLALDCIQRITNERV